MTFLFLIVSSLYSQDTKINNSPIKYKLDYTNPISVVNGLIEASKNKDLELNFLVFDPFIRGDLYEFRMLYFTNDQNGINSLLDIRNSYVNGAAVFSQDGRTATVPMWYKSSVRKEYQEQIELINRFGNWYILSF